MENILQFPGAHYRSQKHTKRNQQFIGLQKLTTIKRMERVEKKETAQTTTSSVVVVLLWLGHVQ